MTNDLSESAAQSPEALGNKEPRMLKVLSNPNSSRGIEVLEETIVFNSALSVVGGLIMLAGQQHLKDKKDCNDGAAVNTITAFPNMVFALAFQTIILNIVSFFSLRAIMRTANVSDRVSHGIAQSIVLAFAIPTTILFLSILLAPLAARINNNIITPIINYFKHYSQDDPELAKQNALNNRNALENPKLQTSSLLDKSNGGRMNFLFHVGFIIASPVNIAFSLIYIPIRYLVRYIHDRKTQQKAAEECATHTTINSPVEQNDLVNRIIRVVPEHTKASLIQNKQKECTATSNLGEHYDSEYYAEQRRSKSVENTTTLSPDSLYDINSMPPLEGCEDDHPHPNITDLELDPDRDPEIALSN